MKTFNCNLSVSKILKDCKILHSNDIRVKMTSLNSYTNHESKVCLRGNINFKERKQTHTSRIIIYNVVTEHDA